jgi:hypothetical protein
MIRRVFIQTSAAALVSAPALPAIAGGTPQLGTTPIHTEAEFRKALMEYIEAYRVWRLLPQSDSYKARWPVRHAWWDIMARLRAMVLDNHGLSHEGIDHSGYYSPVGLASRMIDLGDMLVIAALDATADELSEQSTLVVLVPRSAEMFRLLDGLPKEDIEEEDEDAEVADDKDAA